MVTTQTQVEVDKVMNRMATTLFQLTKVPSSKRFLRRAQSLTMKLKQLQQQREIERIICQR